VRADTAFVATIFSPRAFSRAASSELFFTSKFLFSLSNFANSFSYWRTLLARLFSSIETFSSLSCKEPQVATYTFKARVVSSNSLRSLIFSAFSFSFSLSTLVTLS
jgi:hypothetical protein